MDKTVDIDLAHVARELGLNPDGVQRTVELLDDGNTVPFITRYRKEVTGALDEEQIRRIQEKVVKMRALAERKATILKSIQSQNRLTPSISEQILAADSAKRLEDLYLPYKPKKQTLATVARQRGLEPLAREVVDADPAAADLHKRAAEFVSPENGLATEEDVLAGVGHIIAEWFSERADLRGRLRKILHRTGKLVCSRLESTRREPVADSPVHAADSNPAPKPTADSQETAPASNDENAPAAPEAAIPPTDLAPPAEVVGVTVPPTEEAGDATTAEQPTLPVTEPDLPPNAEESQQAASVDPSATAAGESSPESGTTQDAVPAAAPETEVESPDIPAQATEVAATPPAPAAPADSQTSESSPAPDRPSQETAPTQSSPSAAKPANKPATAARVSKKQKKRQKMEAAFKDYFDFQEPISKIPPHRVLAINRGERAKILRVKLEADVEALFTSAEKMLVQHEQPHADFLRNCVRDALCRLLIPSLEREVRREMTERAEEHAVGVFAQNLRKLLLQPPVHGHRVLAVDPGFRSGCKLIALDEFGRVLGHEVVHVIGKDERIKDGRAKLAELVRKHRLSVVAIGNGTACRETEQFVVSVMEDELKDDDLSFVIVNEAGASVYSTSPLGREELPGYDAVLRSAISIGRRLLDPLSELVKINPANIGVGMYQHDVKAKHLRDSLDAVVESCVNYVGVDVNTASPALLRYVSGLNQLTARRLCEYRNEHGPFRNREQFRQVPGFGDATFVQSAGFLKITNGDNPLDSTWIHPESYELAWSVLERLECTPAEFAQRVQRTKPEIDQAETVSASADSPTHDVPAPPVEAESSEPDSAPADISIQEVSSPLAEAETPAPETPAPETPAPETPAPETPAPETPAPETPAPESAEPDSPAVAADGPLPTGEVTDATPEVPPPPAEQEPQVPSTVPANAPLSLAERVGQVDLESLSQELSNSPLLLKDILASLARPGRDPREDLPPPVFRRGIVKLEDLEPGMQLSGTVLNVVDFGAFVDIGLPDSGLVHISRLADRFVRDPHEVVGVGDVISVWVVEVDKARRRVSLTAIEPGTETPPQQRPSRGRQRKTERKPEGKRRPRSGNRPDGQASKVPPPKHRSHQRTPKRPKAVTPITKEMEDGKEPLRSFSDLMQFYQKKQTDEDSDKS
jgi:uncharacterized protein